MHAVGASMFFLAVYIHIGRGLYYGSYKAPREVLWIIGVVILLLMMATAFMGYSLPWGQMSFWAVTVITNLFSSLDSIIPGPRHAHRAVAVGRLLGVGHHADALLQPALPAAVRDRRRGRRCTSGRCTWSGQNNPTGLEIKTASDSVPMAPHAVMKDVFALSRVRAAVRLVRVLPARLSGPPRQLHRGQPALDAAAHRAGVVLPALLRHPARHPQQAARRDRHVLVDHPADVRALARHLARALGQVPPGLQVVLLAVHHLGGRARLSRLQAAGGRLRVLGAHLHGLLLHALPGRHADRRRDRRRRRRCRARSRESVLGKGGEPVRVGAPAAPERR